MISPKSHTAEWIHAQRESLAGADPIILEKTIFALTLLDVVTEPNVLQHLEPKTITTSFLDLESPVTVQTPKLESLLADKLTAFAPNSIGVPLTKHYSQQVIKQLFDIAQLYDIANDLAFLRQENLNSFQAEAHYCNYQGSHHDYLDDLIDTAFRLSAIDLHGAPTDQLDQEKLLRQGIRQLSNHLISHSFALPQAKIAASKAACLASLLKSEKPITLPRYTPEAIPQLQAATIVAPHSCLTRLKSFAPEVFFHWIPAMEDPKMP